MTTPHPATKQWIWTIFVAALLELGMLTFFKNSLGPRISPLILLFSGLFVGIAPLYFLRNQKLHFEQAARSNPKNRLLTTVLPMLLGFGACAYLLHQEITDFPITDFRKVEGSDVIPQIGILVERFLNGEFPYRWIGEWSFSHQLYPTYLPLTWMPYILADAIHLDYRWFAFGCLSIAFITVGFRMLPPSKSMLSQAVLAVLPFLFLFAFLLEDNEGIFRYAVETLIAAFYLFVGLSLTTRSNTFRGIALLFCLLSRYSLVLWLPLFFFMTLLQEGRKSTIQILGILFAGVLLIYVPFLLVDSSIFIKGYDYHSAAAFHAWKVMPWQKAGELPFHLYNGLGLGWTFYENWEGTLLEKVDAYRDLHKVVSLAVPVLFGILYWNIKAQIDYRLFLLCSFKVYLVVFYNFIQIPFSYLFLVPILFSIPLLYYILGSRSMKRQAKS
ncbi:MAG: hypothetical protein AAF738_02715 [Bacteroidota bacterium]